MIEKADSKLIFEVATGNQESFEMLYARHKDKVVGILTNLEIPLTVLDDLCQNIWMQVWKKANTFRGDSQVTSWVYRIASNEGLAWIRDRKSHPLHACIRLDSHYLEIASDTSQIEDVLEAKEILERMNKIFLKEVHKKQFKLFYIKYFSRLSPKEVTKKLKLNPRGINNAVDKVKNKLKSCLDAELIN